MSTFARLPSVILTGFLGSGKTTLINRLMQDPAFQRSAVLVNEFGEVPLDHELIAQSEERLVVLPGGCVCCALREDVEGALRQLFERRDAGEIPAFEQLIIETTGLADPIPLLMTLQGFRLARERLEAPLVVTTVDASLHEATVARHPQASRQVVAAHLVLVTKADLAGEDRTGQVVAAAARLNPWARIEVARGAEQLAQLLRESREVMDRPWDMKALDLMAPREQGWMSGKYVKVGNAHAAVSFPVVFDTPVDWSTFGVWLTLLLHRHGQNVLRVKGLLNVSGLKGPVAVHAAQHMVHPPEHLQAWPSDERRTRLVFIVERLEPEAIVRSMKAFLDAASAPSTAPHGSFHVGAGAGGTVGGRPIRRPTAPRWIRG